MGHYVVAKRYHVRASLPFFLPSVPPLGTLGAFISMRDPIPNRRALLDIGVSGPLVGFAIAIPVTLAGLPVSTAPRALPPHAGGEAVRAPALFSFLSLFFPPPSAVFLPPPLNDLTRLDPARKLVGIVAVAILIVTFVPQPFAPVGTQRDLAFEAVPGFPFPINATIALATSIRLVFAVNDTGAAPENVVVNLRENNLNEFGFVIRFTALQIGTATTPA